MKFGHQYEAALANEGFPTEWVNNAIEYKHLKQVIKRVHKELDVLGLDQETLDIMREIVAKAPAPSSPAPKTEERDYFSAAKPTLGFIKEEFSPTVRILVDSKTGVPLDARLAPETKESLRNFAKHETVARQRHHVHEVRQDSEAEQVAFPDDESSRRGSAVSTVPREDARWITVSLGSAGDFFEMLEPSLKYLEDMRKEETRKLEDQIFELGDKVNDIVMPVREGFEAVRKLKYRELYFWREMFRMYQENPIFYAQTERRRGALPFDEAKSNLEEFDRKLRETGLFAKMKTAKAREATQMFLDLNLQILKVMHFQEMNSTAMRKILKKFDKQTHLPPAGFIQNLQSKYPAMVTNNATVAGGFADSIARDLQAELSTKVLAITPQLDDWTCPICYGLAWRPVSLGCCKSVFCITCIIKLQNEGHSKCPVCNQETVMKANGMNLDMSTMDFIGIYFPMEVKERQAQNERAALLRQFGEEYVNSHEKCTVM